MTDEFRMKHEMRVSVRVEAEGMQTVDLTIEVPDHQGDFGADAVCAARQLVTGLAGVLSPEMLAKNAVANHEASRPENRQYPGQPGEKVKAEISQDGVKVPIPSDAASLFLGTDGSIKMLDRYDAVEWSAHAPSVDPWQMHAYETVLRLRKKLAERAGKGLDPMLDAELTAILDGDAADDELMGVSEIDKHGMYGDGYQQITEARRHHFNSMSANAQCLHCRMTRRVALTDYDTRICRSVDG
jgi:hypothetical protein